MKVISKKSKKILYLSLQKLSLTKQPIKGNYVMEDIETITGLTFQEFRTLLIHCTTELTEAYGLMGREQQWEKALQLAEINQKFEAFAQKNTHFAIN